MNDYTILENFYLKMNKMKFILTYLKSQML